MKQVEILAPAGSFDSIRAAVHGGCDAVYVGGSRFGARAFADNLTEEQMCEAIDFVHFHGKKLYMTVNTLVKERELDQLYDFLHPFYVQGLDAVIVQDVGVMRLLHRQFPELPIHASTQMTLHGPYGIGLLQDYGVTRLVPARELSLEELGRIREKTELELECFVHGALCYCYSGQCLMSSMIGGRSGNRGRCAQPCRNVYESPDQRRKGEGQPYLLSPKDMCTLDRIPDLVEAGIDSFKIEGRMKRPEYSGLTSYLYRKYTDLFLELGRERYEEWMEKNSREFREDKTALADLYNRGGFSGGYYHRYHGKTMMSMERPNHSGVEAGLVKKVKGTEASVLLTEDLYPQDVVEFRRDGTACYEYTRGEGAARGTMITARFKPGSDIRPGDRLYRTRRNELLDRIRTDWLEKDRQLPVRGVLFLETGHPMRLELSCKDAGITLTGETVEEAVNQPLTEEAAARVLKKTGKEPFYFEELNVKIRGSAFQTVGKLKELRRKGFARLGEQITGEYRREPVEKINKNVREMRSNSFCSPATIPLEAVVREPEQLKAVMEVPEAGRVFLPSEWEREELLQAFSEGKKAGKEMCLALPRMCREREQQFLEAEAAREDSLFVAADGFLISNMEAAAFLKAHGFFGKTPDCAVLDHSLYVFNREAAAFWNEQGFCRMTAPLELNAGELSLLDLSGSSVVLYGYMTLMISAQCVKDNRSGCTGIPETEEIRDGQKRKFYVRNHCRFCYNEILNGDPLWLGGQAGEIASLMPAALRFVFTIEGGKETKTILEAFIRGRKTERQVPYPGGRFFTKGHYARGVE